MNGRASGRIGRWGVAISAIVLCTVSLARANVTSERGSSILVFPKVISDADGLQTGYPAGANRGFPVDTIIQISNTSNSMVFAHCFYVTSTPLDPTRAPSMFNPPQWQEVDFDLVLTKQQPTHWVVGPGRPNVPAEPQCSRIPFVDNCNGAGFDPGPIPPISDPFVGQLICVEVDSSGFPINGNRLKGEATLVTPHAATTTEGIMPRGEVSKYNAIGFQGLNTDTNSNDSDLKLCIGGDVRDGCPGGAEYEGCPNSLLLSHFAAGSTDPIIDTLSGGSSSVETEVTLVPCTQDFENSIPGQVVVQFKVTNEFEELLSASTTVTCWSNFRLQDVGQVFQLRTLGSRFVQTRMTPGGPDQPRIIGVAEEFHIDGRPAVDVVTRAAFNLHGEDWAPDPLRPSDQPPVGDMISIPEAP